MPQKEACENRISDKKEMSEEWRIGYMGVSDLIRRVATMPLAIFSLEQARPKRKRP
jgi:hypothetical protein